MGLAITIHDAVFGSNYPLSEKVNIGAVSRYKKKIAFGWKRALKQKSISRNNGRLPLGTWRFTACYLVASR